MSEYPRVPGFTCPLCRRTTYNENDMRHEHCPCCGMPGLPKCCEHDPDGSRQMARLYDTPDTVAEKARAASALVRRARDL